MEGLYACMFGQSLLSDRNDNNSRIIELMLPRPVSAECFLAWTPVLLAEF